MSRKKTSETEQTTTLKKISLSIPNEFLCNENRKLCKDYVNRFERDGML